MTIEPVLMLCTRCYELIDVPVTTDLGDKRDADSIAVVITVDDADAWAHRWMHEAQDEQ